MEDMTCVECGKKIALDTAKCKDCGSVMDCDDGECNCACGKSQPMSDMWCAKCLRKHAEDNA